jgi:hypothetical protein
MSRTNSILPTSIERESESGDRPPGANEAASGRFEKPRAEPPRGTSNSRSAGFYAQLPRKLVDSGRAFVPSGTQSVVSWSKMRIATSGEWVGSARWIAMRAPDVNSDRERPDAPGDSGGDNLELGQIISAIAEDVGRHCAAVCDGINADFAARAAHARKFLPRSQVAGTLQALKQARQAALALARQTARSELQGRKQTAIALYARQRRRSIKGGSAPRGGTPHQGPN